MEGEPEHIPGLFDIPQQRVSNAKARIDEAYGISEEIEGKLEEEPSVVEKEPVRNMEAVPEEKPQANMGSVSYTHLPNRASFGLNGAGAVYPGFFGFCLEKPRRSCVC